MRPGSNLDQILHDVTTSVTDLATSAMASPPAGRPDGAACSALFGRFRQCLDDTARVDDDAHPAERNEERKQPRAAHVVCQRALKRADQEDADRERGDRYRNDGPNGTVAAHGW